MLVLIGFLPTKMRCVIAQNAEPLAVMLASHVGVLVSVPSALFPIQLPASVLGKAAEDDLSNWAPGGVFLSSGFGHPSLSCYLAVAATWGVKQPMEESQSPFFFFSVALHFK